MKRFLEKLLQKREANKRRKYTDVAMILLSGQQKLITSWKQR